MPRHKLVKDPANFHLQFDLKQPLPGLKLALGVDLGTTTGISFTYFDPTQAWLPGERTIYSGQLDLSVGDFDSGAIRYVRLRQFLAKIDPDLVMFEDAQYYTKENFGPKPTVHQVIARTARPIELLGSLKATLGTWCEERNIPCVGFPIQAIKKRATSKGNANKEMVIRAANEEFGSGLEVEDYEKTGVDNLADSLYCLVLGLEMYSQGFSEEAPRTSKRRIQDGPEASAG
jgi:hypothetical protein